jgi:hypothetical protein
MQLCHFSKSEIHERSILHECPLDLTAKEAKECPCRKRLYHVPPADLRVLSCTFPDNWKGEPIRDPQALAAKLKSTSKVNKSKRGKESMSTATPANTEPTKEPTLSRAKPQGLTVYARISDPMDFIAKMGLTIYDSKMFGCANAAQGRMLALAFLTRGVDPFEFRARHHVIGGNVTLSAEAMLADFRVDLGGSHQIVARTPEKAAIELTLGKKKQLFEFTWQEARAEDYVYNSAANDGKIAKEVNGAANPQALKDNWKTPRRRMQMLWARVVSDAVGAMAPEICGGRLTPEELDVLSNEARTEGAPCAVSSSDDSVIDGEFEVKTEPSQEAASVANAAPAATAAPATSSPAPDMTTKLELPDPPPADVQRMNLLRELKSLKTELALSQENYTKALEKRGVKSAMELDLAELEGIVNSLRSVKAKRAESVERAQWPESSREGKS